ncbi:speriolin-like protein [Lissotriton helveticus]
MDGNNKDELEIVREENIRLLQENCELRKLVGLMQENAELRAMLSEDRRDVPASCPKKDACPQKAKDECAEPQQVHKMGRIVGEIAFQLDRRILAYIFQDRIRLYGITVSNIPQKIKEATSCRSTGKVDEEQKSNLKLRYKCIMDKLSQFDYDPCVHPGFSEYIVNLFGILKERPQPGSEELKHLMDPENLKKMATSTVPESDLQDVLILLKCLTQLSKEDGKPVFVW